MRRIFTIGGTATAAAALAAVTAVSAMALSFSATPVVTINGKATELRNPWGVAFDSSGLVYAGNSDARITVYAADADGDATPVDIITGGSTGLGQVRGLAFDGAGNLYAANRTLDTVTVYSAGASGDQAPDTTISTGSQPTGIAVTSSRLIVAEYGAASVSIFDLTGTLIRTIAGGTTGLTAPSSVAVDADGRIWVVDDSNAILVFGASATGDVAPLWTIAGAATRLSTPRDIAFDASGTIWVTNADGVLLAFAPGSVGNVEPVESITVTRPRGLAFDAPGRMWVSDGGIDPSSTSDDSLLAFRPLPSTGGQAPPPWLQQYGRASADATCLPGWSPSWAEWTNEYTGGWVCQRAIYWNTSTGSWWESPDAGWGPTTGNGYPFDYSGYPVDHPQGPARPS